MCKMYVRKYNLFDRIAALTQTVQHFLFALVNNTSFMLTHNSPETAKAKLMCVVRIL